MWISPGFTHGFVTLSGTAEFLYMTNDYYALEFEHCIAWDDPEIGIAWPAGLASLLSAKDLAGMGLAQAEVFA